jgi:hypothetical protein
MTSLPSPRAPWCCFLLLAATAPAFSQTLSAPVDETAGDAVSWTAAPPSSDAIRQRGAVTLTVSGSVREGWHVYSLQQLPDGPTALRVTVDANAIATAAGAVAGSAPTRILDPRFGLETQFYSHAFTLRVPVRLAAHLVAGRALIPVSVRFQTCNDEICRPPRTVRLSVPIDVPAPAS